MKRRRLAAVLALGALVVAAGIPPAYAEPTVMAALPGSYLTPSYGMPGTVAQVGGELTFVNLDVQRHDVQAATAVAPVQCTSPNPEICPAGTPTWCLPADPTKAWTSTGGDNDLPFPPGTCPMLWSRLIGVGGMTDVFGLEYLTSGRTYEFLCSIHRGMRGTLVAV